MRISVIIILTNIAIYGLLILAYSINIGLSQTISQVIAGIVFGLIFTILSWTINRSQMSYLEKRNLLASLHIIISVVIFWLAAVVGNGSIFKLHKIEDLDGFSLLFTDGIFGLMSGFGVLFDYALSERTSRACVALLVSLLGFSLMIVWYASSDGLLFVVSLIITRIILSILINRVFIDQLKNQMMTLRALSVSLTFIVLPITAFLSK